MLKTVRSFAAFTSAIALLAALLTAGLAGCKSTDGEGWFSRRDGERRGVLPPNNNRGNASNNQGNEANNQGNDSNNDNLPPVEREQRLELLLADGERLTPSGFVSKVQARDRLLDIDLFFERVERGEFADDMAVLALHDRLARTRVIADDYVHGGGALAIPGESIVIEDGPWFSPRQPENAPETEFDAQPVHTERDGNRRETTLDATQPQRQPAAEGNRRFAEGGFTFEYDKGWRLTRQPAAGFGRATWSNSRSGVEFSVTTWAYPVGDLAAYAEEQAHAAFEELADGRFSNGMVDETDPTEARDAFGAREAYFTKFEITDFDDDGNEQGYDYMQYVFSVAHDDTGRVKTFLITLLAARGVGDDDLATIEATFALQ